MSRMIGPYVLAAWSNKDRLAVQHAERWVPPAPPGKADAAMRLLYDIAVLWCGNQETPTLETFCRAAGCKPTALLRWMTRGGIQLEQLQRTTYCLWVSGNLRLSMILHFNGSTQVMPVNAAGQPDTRLEEEVVVPRQPRRRVPQQTPDAFELYDKLRMEYEKRK